MSDNLWGDSPQTSDSGQGKPVNNPQQGHHVPADSKEWRLIEKMVNSLSLEQRRSRRWGIFFKLLTFGYLFVALYLFVGDRFDEQAISSEPHTALIDIQGAISADSEANADSIVHGLRSAFKDENTEAIVLRINSPGGSPVQAGYVYDEIKRLRELHPQTKVYAVISDIGASGAYYIAAAADEIYADKASLVGSIGVISSSFGFVEVLQKLGVERRVMTAGEHKAFLDPFAPLKPTERQFWEGVLETTHQQFIDQVKKGRGDRLTDDTKLFSGLIWTGEQSLQLGLVDGLGSTGYVAREVIGVDNIVDFTPSMSRWEKLVERFGVSMGRTLATELGLKTPPLQ